MATVKPTITFIGKGERVMKFTWALTTANPDGAPIPPQYADFADRTVYFDSAAWGGATAAWEGGDGTTYLPCGDAQGTAITKTANTAVKRVVENPEFARPNLTTVGVGAVITATCIARKP